MENNLRVVSETTIRFSDVDSMGFVWHGNYVRFFEDGREAFGLKFGFHYLDIYSQGYFAPIVKLNIEYKQALHYGDTAVIETEFINCNSAKVMFKYKILRKSDNELIATGETTQVFLNLKRELELNIPPFFEEWKIKNCLLKTGFTD